MNPNTLTSFLFHKAQNVEMVHVGMETLHLVEHVYRIQVEFLVFCFPNTEESMRISQNMRSYMKS
jgi:hypothetical protein